MPLRSLLFLICISWEISFTFTVPNIIYADVSQFCTPGCTPDLCIQLPSWQLHQTVHRHHTHSPHQTQTVSPTSKPERSQLIKTPASNCEGKKQWHDDVSCDVFLSRFPARPTAQIVVPNFRVSPHFGHLLVLPLPPVWAGSMSSLFFFF